MPSHDVILKDRAGRNKLLEFLVDKRCRSLDYLRTLHAGEALWMNSIYLTPTDLAMYFSTATAADGMMPPGDSPSSSHAHVRQTSTLRVGTTCTKDWLEYHCREWLILGHSLGSLVQLSLSGVEFLDVITELLLELAVHTSTNAASRALASRALKKDRESRGLKHHVGIQTITQLGGYTYLCIPQQVAQGSDMIPSYGVVVPPLCSILQFTYRKLCDYDICASESDFKKLLAVDRRLKDIFFGSISKELSKLAQIKLHQQRSWISDNLMAAFSQGETGPTFNTFAPLQEEDADSGSAQAVLVDRDSKEYFFDDDDDTYAD